MRYSKTAGPPKAPEPMPYRPAATRERISRQSEDPAPPERKSIMSRMWPFKSTNKATATINLGTQDPARGAEAARRFVKEGVLDARYKGAARRVTALLCSLPIAIYLSYELFERRFMGREQKTRPVVSHGHAAHE